MLYGSATGVTTAGAFSFNQDSIGVPGTAEPGDQFGYSLRAARIIASARNDLVVGMPLEDSDSATDNGGIILLPSSSSGLVGLGSQWFSASTLGGTHPAQNNAIFGETLG